MSNSPDVKVICLTPVRNEAWILSQFLDCASLWADHIIIADQSDQDDSRSIIRRYPKVELIELDWHTVDLGQMRTILWEKARRIPGRRIILALDADEFLSANWVYSVEWKQILEAKPGTQLGFQWPHILPNFQNAWLPPEYRMMGYIDDEKPYQGRQLHELKIPTAESTLRLNEIKILHYQTADWSRYKSKLRWYQCWERIQHLSRRPIQLYRQYHLIDSFPAEQLVPTESSWFDGYQQNQIDMKMICQSSSYWWDQKVLDLLIQHGTHPFRRLDIWDIDWQALFQNYYPTQSIPDLRDPRTNREKQIMRFLERTQPEHLKIRIRWLQRLLIPFGW